MTYLESGRPTLVEQAGCATEADPGWLVNNGMPLEEVSRYLGHSSTDVTRRYACQTPDALGRRAADALRALRACGDRVRSSYFSARRRARDGQAAVTFALARPTGVGRAISTYTIPIEGRDEWLAAAKRLA